MKKINHSTSKKGLQESLVMDRKVIRNNLKIDIESVKIEQLEDDHKNLKNSQKGTLKDLEDDLKLKSEEIKKTLKEKNLSSDKIFANYGVKSQAGMMNGVSKINQDSYFIETKLLGVENLAILAVFDGHGNNGHRVSGFLRSRLRSKISLSKKNKVF